MTTVREEIKHVLAQFREATEPNPIAAQFYFKLGITSYHEFIRLSPLRSPEVNKRALDVAYEFCEKAITLGIREETMELPLFNLRRHWVPKLRAQEQL